MDLLEEPPKNINRFPLDSPSSGFPIDKIKSKKNILNKPKISYTLVATPTRTWAPSALKNLRIQVFQLVFNCKNDDFHGISLHFME